MNFMEILLIYNVMYRHINFFFYGNENIFAYHYTLQAHTHIKHKHVVHFTVFMNVKCKLLEGL